MSAPVCWCGNTDLENFSGEYRRCPSCQTLVWVGAHPGLAVDSRDVEGGFYGKEYFLARQVERGLPDLFSRARGDLTDRCPYWLSVLLRHRPPPARVLEIGSSHGAYLALLGAAGYLARGLELSQWVVDFSRQQFGVQVDMGTVDSAPFKPGSFDIVVMNDVLEHLPDPLATLSACVRLLAPTGLLVIQTPCYSGGATLSDLQGSRSPFLKMLLPREHIYLFSQAAARDACRRAGLPQVRFEPAYFAEQDMFFLASAAEWQPLPETQPLQNGPAQRLAQALLDLHALNSSIDADRAARLDQIHALTAEALRLQTELAAARRRAAELERIPSWLPRWLIHRAARLFRQK